MKQENVPQAMLCVREILKIIGPLAVRNQKGSEGERRCGVVSDSLAVLGTLVDEDASEVDLISALDNLGKYCGTCRLWDRSCYDEKDDGVTTSLCRRNPPMVDDRSGEGVWPKTEDRDYCGEYLYDPEFGNFFEE